MSRKWIARVMLAGSCFVMLSCPNPLDEAMLLHVKDAIGPVITVLSPAEGSSYAATVVVTGRVRDDSTASGDPGAVESMLYEVLGTALSGDIAVSPDGQFSFQFSTTNLSGTVVVRITAKDWNGNPVTASLTLVDQGAIPSFSALPDNGKVRLQWDAVPLADHYTIYYEKTNAIPNELYSPRIENAVSPFVLSNLINGNMHVFLLRAHSSSGGDNWSEAGAGHPALAGPPGADPHPGIPKHPGGVETDRCNGGVRGRQIPVPGWTLLQPQRLDPRYKLHGLLCRTGTDLLLRREARSV